jgi:hypothetical protein
MGRAVNIETNETNEKINTMRKNKFNEISEKQKQGLNPLTESEISDAGKNTMAQRFRETTFGNNIGGGINENLESRYQLLTATPEYSESTNAFRSQMALRKSRQASTRLGG